MRRIAVLALALAAAPLAAQATHPNYSGKWTLDTSASPPGPMTPSSMTMTVTQDEKTLKVESAASTQMGDQKVSETLNLDGSPSKNTVNGGGMDIDLTSTTAWEDAGLVVTTKADVQGQSLQQVDHWSLSPDGTTMTLTRNVSFSGQAMDLKLVFKKA